MSLVEQAGKVKSNLQQAAHAQALYNQIGSAGRDDARNTVSHSRLAIRQ